MTSSPRPTPLRVRGEGVARDARGSSPRAATRARSAGDPGPVQPRSRRAGLRQGLALLVSMATVAGIAATGVQPAAAATQSASVRPQHLVHTNTAAPTTNYGSAKELAFSKSQYRTFLRYDTSAVAAKSTIVSAQLELTVTRSTATTRGVEVRRAGTAWTAATVTDARKPAVTDLLNPGDPAVPRSGSTVTLRLTGLAGQPVTSALGLQLSYAVPLVPVRFSRTTPPVLRLVTTPPATSTTTVPPTATASDQLPYATAPLGSTQKKLFAHYFPPYPISLDNREAAVDYYTRHYLNPAGENGKFESVGGLLRDRPVTRPVLAGDYKMIDAQTEVRQAVDAGVEGFLTDIMSFTGNSWTGSLRLSEAAARSGTGFVVAPNVDMSSPIVSLPVSTVASYLAEFYRTPGAYRLPDGRFVLSTFKAEAKPATYWRALIAELKNKHQVDVAWVGIMLSLSDAQIAEYAPISYALGVWGARDADLTMRMRNLAAAVHQRGVKYMAPIAVQDVRHHKLSYAESNNTELLRATWSRAINDGADFAQLVTWNDYSESTSFAPSAAHRSAFLDVNGYYANQFRKGVPSALQGDELVVTHRIQKVTTKPTVQTTTMVSTQSGSRTPPRDTVEVLSMLKAPAAVTLTVGSSTKTVNAPAGVSQFTLPLGTGTISAKAVRSGQAVATVTSPHPVVSSIKYWNLQYYAATSRENPTR